ncbi:hypothetical protein B0H19DRAFT_1083555 [Mycena capillaripes]|nr:hypothetical protein B0H19DRAFT_1083555 [Mycena capillaripes]
MTGGAQGRLGLFTLVISAFNTRGAFLCKCIWAPVLSRKFFDPSLRKCRVRSRFFVHIPILHIPQSPPPRRVPKKFRAVLSYSSEGDSRAFSSSSLTGTKLRNSLHHDLFGALQLLKSAYRTGRISASAIAARHIDALISELDVDFGFSAEEGGKNYVRFCVRTRLNAEPNALNLNAAFRFKVQRGREPNARFRQIKQIVLIRLSCGQVASTFISNMGCRGKTRRMLFSGVSSRKDVLGNANPPNKFSTAELQQYLQIHGASPDEAASGAHAWVEQTRADRHEKENGEADHRRQVDKQLVMKLPSFLSGWFPLLAA